MRTHILAASAAMPEGAGHDHHSRRPHPHSWPSAAAAGAIFIGVQIGHPQLNSTSITSTDVFVRDQLKVLMCGLAVIGITGMYLSQIRRNGLLGLIGYAVMAAGYLGIMCVTFAAAYIFPEVAPASARYVNDVIAVDTGRGTSSATSAPCRP